jgi:O-methyltransferase involved in polyketide biosynthesis
MIELPQTKVKISLSGLPQTSLMPLYGRVKVSKTHNSLFNDAKAVEIVEQTDYDFSIIDTAVVDYFWFTYAARAIQFDAKVKAYIKEHPRASVVNLGAGFETEFYRVDNGTIRWYDLDLPELIEIRKQLLPETDRVTCIAKSFLDPGWCNDINAENGVFVIAGGLFHYYDEPEVRRFISLLADSFPGCEIVCEAESRSSVEVDGNYGAYGAGWSDDEAEKRNAIQAEAMRAFKNLWMIAPPALREQMIGALTTPTKPQSAEWDDFEMWWNQLGAMEKGKAMSDFVAGSDITCKSPLEDAREIATWDDRIAVVDQFPLFRNIPRDPSLSMSVRQFMDYTDVKGRIKIFHLRV